MAPLLAVGRGPVAAGAPSGRAQEAVEAPARREAAIFVVVGPKAARARVMRENTRSGPPLPDTEESRVPLPSYAPEADALPGVEAHDARAAPVAITTAAHKRVAAPEMPVQAPS